MLESAAPDPEEPFATVGIRDKYCDKLTTAKHDMKILFKIVLVLLTLLAAASGITKVMLMEQDVGFFGRYGFSDPALIAFGAVQLMGGALLPFNKTRFVGAVAVAITFLVSLVLLIMDGNVPVSIATIVMTLLLGVVMKQSWKKAPAEL